MKKALAKKETLYVLSIIFFLLSVWPMISWDHMSNPQGIVFYYYGIWLALIIILMVRCFIVRKIDKK